MLTSERLRELLLYDPDTGLWVWLKPPKNKPQLIGQEAGNIRLDGYRKIGIGGTDYLCGPLAWLYMTGEWPTEEVDHADRDRSNDRWENIRQATRSLNEANKGLDPRNTSGFRGVTWHKGTQKWMAQINGIYLGVFEKIEDAVAVRDATAQDVSGSFAFLNPQVST